MPLHSTLTGADLHEPKGAASASANTAYFADGAGSGSWGKVTQDRTDTTSIFTMNRMVLTTHFTDVTTAETLWVVVPCNCTLNSAYTVIAGAIATADETITIANHSGTTAGTITIANAGSAAGDIDTATFSSNNTFTAGQRVRITTAGASTGAVKCFVTLVFTVTGVIS